MLIKLLFWDFNTITIFVYAFMKNIFFLIDNVSLFSIRSAFCNKFMASFLLIELKIQRYSESLMFKIAILLRFIDIINKS